MASTAGCGGSGGRGDPPKKKKDEEEADPWPCTQQGKKRKQYLWEEDPKDDKDAKRRLAIAKYSKKYRDKKKKEREDLIMENMQLTVQVQKESEEIAKLEELDKMLDEEISRLL